MSVLVCDVGPRDGLQNERAVLPPAVRAELAMRLARAGLQRVEVASFVHPERVPQMAGAEEVVAALKGRENCWSGMVLNERGYDRARATGLGRINITVPVTDTFSQRNQACSRSEAVAMAKRVLGRAQGDGIAVTVTLAVSFGCPFEGAVAVADVLAVAEEIAASDPDELVVADTIGVGLPTQVRQLIDNLRPLGITFGAHFHDTHQTGIANAVAAVEAGVRLLDASIGGVGGCPFAPGATGNVATEDLVYVLGALGIKTGIDRTALLDCSEWLAAQLGDAQKASPPARGPTSSE